MIKHTKQQITTDTATSIIISDLGLLRKRSQDNKSLKWHKYFFTMEYKELLT